MAGSRIKGITVEIGGDTTKLQTVLRDVNSEIKNIQSQLKDVEKLLKLDPGNTELLAQKQKLLSSAISETKEKLLHPYSIFQYKHIFQNLFLSICFLQKSPLSRIKSRFL